MVRVLRRRFCLGGYAPCFGLAAVLAISGCGESAERPQENAPDSSSELSQAAGEDLGWPGVVGAAEYQVQAWSHLRLLFSERTSSPRLEMTASLERALMFFPDAVLRVEARGDDGRVLGEPIEMTVESARRADP